MLFRISLANSDSNKAIPYTEVKEADQKFLYNAVKLAEKISTSITMAASMVGGWTGTKFVDYKKGKQKTAPPSIVFLKGGNSDLTVFLQQAPAFGFFGYDSTYGGYPIGEEMKYTGYRDNVFLQMQSLTSNSPLVDIYVITDKFKRLR